MSRYRGQPVSEGVAIGAIYPGDEGAGRVAAADADAVRSAFAAVAAERTAFATRLRARGEDMQAGIVEIGALMAADPALTGPALRAVEAGVDAVTAVTEAAEAQAGVLAALADPELAQRASDVRQVAGAVLAQLRADAATPAPESPFILVRRDVDPAELIHLADAEGSWLAGAVSVNGGATSHAAIIARSLGLPMLAGADPAVLRLPAGHRALLDAWAGELVTGPAVAPAAAVPRDPAASSPVQAAITSADGHPVTLLCNVASAAETRLGLSAGAAGVGLLRTEIGFTNAGRWPEEADHYRQLEPILRRLAGRPAVVRLLDFSGDKIPPFLRDDSGLTALLRAPGALDAQLRAIVRAGYGAGADVCVLIPMVTSPDEISHVRDRLISAAADCGTDVPELGIMVEVADTAAHAARFAKLADFFSIGTNDLTSEVLGIDRADPRSIPARAADPRVLNLIEVVLTAADDAGIKVSVCGDAAADPQVLPLLLALGVRTLSVGAASVGRVADQVRATGTGSVHAAN
jgi:phosphoenolpyruvate-protein kinase (PTS system EI component)